MKKHSGFTTHQSKTPVHGFTLIELLVVISIISILSVVGFVSYQNVTSKAKDAKMKADIDAIKKAYETNYDPSANGGQGGYKVLSDTDFASGKIPTPNGTTGTSYILAGPDASGLNINEESFLICAPLNGNTGTCTATSATCYCGSSTGGSGTPTFQIGEENTAGTSCAAILSNNGAVANGVYWIKPASVASAYQVYCDMTTDGGGWTLLMKSDGNTSTFQYSANYWTTNNTLNSEVPSNFDINASGDAKYQAFNELPITGIRVTFPTLNHTMKETVTSQTALSLFNTTAVIAEGTAAFSKFQGFGLDNDLPYQSGYREYGFNLTCVSHAKVRWGWMWNNESICSSNDASSGIGLEVRYSTSAGGWSTCCSSMANTGYPKKIRIWGK